LRLVGILLRLGAQMLGVAGPVELEDSGVSGMHLEA
jgi:hypothetical protein